MSRPRWCRAFARTAGHRRQGPVQAACGLPRQMDPSSARPPPRLRRHGAAPRASGTGRRAGPAGDGPAAAAAVPGLRHGPCAGYPIRARDMTPVAVFAIAKPQSAARHSKGAMPVERGADGASKRPLCAGVAPGIGPETDAGPEGADGGATGPGDRWRRMRRSRGRGRLQAGLRHAACRAECAPIGHRRLHRPPGHRRARRAALREAPGAGRRGDGAGPRRGLGVLGDRFPSRLLMDRGGCLRRPRQAGLSQRRAGAVPLHPHPGSGKPCPAATAAGDVRPAAADPQAARQERAGKLPGRIQPAEPFPRAGLSQQPARTGWRRSDGQGARKSQFQTVHQTAAGGLGFRPSSSRRADRCHASGGAATGPRAGDMGATGPAPTSHDAPWPFGCHPCAVRARWRRVLFRAGPGRPVPEGMGSYRHSGRRPGLLIPSGTWLRHVLPGCGQRRSPLSRRRLAGVAAWCIAAARGVHGADHMEADAGGLHLQPGGQPPDAAPAAAEGPGRRGIEAETAAASPRSSGATRARVALSPRLEVRRPRGDFAERDPAGCEFPGPGVPAAPARPKSHLQPVGADAGLRALDGVAAEIPLRLARCASGSRRGAPGRAGTGAAARTRRAAGRLDPGADLRCDAAACATRRLRAGTETGLTCIRFAPSLRIRGGPARWSRGRGPPRGRMTAGLPEELSWTCCDRDGACRFRRAARGLCRAR